MSGHLSQVTGTCYNRNIMFQIQLDKGFEIRPGGCTISQYLNGAVKHQSRNTAAATMQSPLHIVGRGTSIIEKLIEQSLHDYQLVFQE